jgi:hypothetical protein
MTDSSPSKEFFSPRRYFLDAPKEQPGTCFVKNDDYADLWQAHERLQQDNARYENGRVVMSIEIDRLRMAERHNVHTVAELQKERDELQLQIYALTNANKSLSDPQGLMKMTQEEWARHLDQYRQPQPPAAVLAPHVAMANAEWDAFTKASDEIRDRAAVTKPAICADCGRGGELIEFSGRQIHDVCPVETPTVLPSRLHERHTATCAMKDGSSRCTCGGSL